MSFTPSLGRLIGAASASFVGGAVVGGVATGRRSDRKATREHQGEKEAFCSSSSSSSPPLPPFATTDTHCRILRHGVPSPLGPTEPICYANHCLQYDPQRRAPVWVAEHLHRDKAFPKKPSANRKRSRFRPDPVLHPSTRAHNEDFFDSGWSRGHMAPAGNNKHCQEAMDDTFLLSNVVPQDFDNNGDFWNRLEIYCRDLTKKFEDVHVISGPLWIAKVKDDKKVKDEEGDGRRKRKRKWQLKKMSHYVIGDNEVSVPTHLYKVVVATEEERKSDGDPLVAAFVVPNKPIPRDNVLKDFEVPLEFLEKKVGYKFLQKLDVGKAKSLCEVEGCRMMDYRSFQSYYVERGIKGARNLHELDRYLKRAKDLELLTPALADMHECKRRELEERRSKNEEKDASAAVAGG